MKVTAETEAIGPDYWPRISELMTEFPILDSAPWPFDPDKLYRWATRASSRQRQIVRFVLDVYNRDFITELDRGKPEDERFGHFDLVDTCAGLDAVHRQVISRWVLNPWWA